MTRPPNFGIAGREPLSGYSESSCRKDRLRALRLRTSGATLEPLPGGAFLVRPDEALQPYPRVLTDRIDHWARVAPDRICVAKRGSTGQWRQITYSEVMHAVCSIGQALLNRRLSAERPVVILSENDLEHFLLILAALHVGVPTSSLSAVLTGAPRLHPTPPYLRAADSRHGVRV